MSDVSSSEWRRSSPPMAGQSAFLRWSTSDRLSLCRGFATRYVHSRPPPLCFCEVRQRTWPNYRSPSCYSVRPFPLFRNMTTPGAIFFSFGSRCFRYAPANLDALFRSTYFPLVGTCSFFPRRFAPPPFGSLPISMYISSPRSDFFFPKSYHLIPYPGFFPGFPLLGALFVRSQIRGGIRFPFFPTPLTLICFQWLIGLGFCCEAVLRFRPSFERIPLSPL